MSYAAKSCSHCGKMFRPSGSLGKFCSRACYFEAKRNDRVKDGRARCSRCKEWKLIDQFIRGRDGRPHSHCKPCNAEWFAERRGGRKKPYTPRVGLDQDEKRRRKRERQKAFRTGPGLEYVRMERRLRVQRSRAAGVMPKQREVDEMWCAQEARCAYCGEHLGGGFHLDHKIPLSRGGTNDKENLHLTCPRCNLRKATMTHEEFLVSKKRRVRRQAPT